MGMFDEISPSLSKRVIKSCPYCLNDYDVEEFWQTKDFSCILKIISLEDIDCNVFEMHRICPHCGKYISVSVNLHEGLYRYRTSGETKYSDELLFCDQSLFFEFRKQELSKSIKDVDVECLKSMSIGYNKLIDSVDLEYDDVYTILHNIIEDFYIIPKRNLEENT